MEIKKIVFTILTIILIITVFIVETQPIKTIETIDPLSISNHVEGGYIFNEAIHATNNFTYGDENLSAICKEFKGNILISYNVDTNHFNFGEYSIITYIGSLRVGILDNAVYGLSLIYGGSKKVQTYLGIKSGNNYHVEFLIDGNLLKFKLDNGFISVNYTINIKNWVGLRYGVPMPYFLKFNETSTDISHIEINNLEIGHIKYIRANIGVIALSELAIVLFVWSFYYNSTLLQPFKYIFAILFFGVLILFLGLNSKIMGFIYATMVGGLGAIFYTYSDYAEVNKIDVDQLVMGGVMLLMTFLLITGVIASEGFYFKLRFVKQLPTNIVFYDFITGSGFVVILISTFLLLVEDRKIFRIIGIFFSQVLSAIFSYLVTSNTTLSISISIFVAFEVYALSRDVFNINKIKLRYAQLLALSELIIVSFMVYFT